MVFRSSRPETNETMRKWQDGASVYCLIAVWGAHNHETCAFDVGEGWWWTLGDVLWFSGRPGRKRMKQYDNSRTVRRFIV